MRYLITGIENGKHFAFYTKWFDFENNFNPDLEMVVFDLLNNQFLSKELGWTEIEEDHL